MEVNKVDLANGETLIDLTSDTVTPQTLVKGVTAHNSKGEQIIGNLNPEGGGSSGGIIDVTELPTSGIDENAVYRVTESYKASATDIYVVTPDAETGEMYAMALFETIEINYNIYIVDEFPADMKIVDLETSTELELYILTTDGIAYINILGMGVMPLGLLFLEEEGFDKGFTNNPYAETEMGLYTTVETYGQCEKWFIRENGEWKEITSYINTILPYECRQVEFLSGEYSTEELIITQEDNFKTISVLEKVRNDKIIPSSIKINGFDIATYISDNGNYVDVDETWFRYERGTLVQRLRAGAFAYTRLNNVVLPDGITSIPHRCFDTSYIQGNLTLPKTLYCIESYAFNSLRMLLHIQIPDSVEYIETSAFNQCSLYEVVLPKSLKEIGGEAFSHSYTLTTVTFQSTPTFKSNGWTADLFNGCKSLTTINVPWSEHEVEGAPWGAINATINYNYTGE